MWLEAVWKLAALNEGGELTVTVASDEALLTQPRDISDWGTPEEATVLPAELRRTQVADAAARVARVHFLKQHQPPRFVQPQDFLVLERAHRGDRLESLVKGRGAVTRGTVKPTYPVAQYPHNREAGGDAIANGFIYRGKLIPTLTDKLVFSDITTGRVWYANRADVLEADTARKVDTGALRTVRQRLPAPAADAARARAVTGEFGAVAPKFVQLTNEVVFDDLWRRPDLALRDRSLVTIAALAATGDVDQLELYVHRGLESGLTRSQITEALTHLGFYAGWSKTTKSLTAVRRTLDK